MHVGPGNIIFPGNRRGKTGKEIESKNHEGVLCFHNYFLGAKNRLNSNNPMIVATPIMLNVNHKREG